MTLYAISDKSYEEIVILAMNAGYVHTTALDGSALGGENAQRRYRGISKYLCEISRGGFHDTRSVTVRKSHAYEREQGLRPSWEGRGDRLRRYRSLDITDDALDRYKRIAIEFGIYEPRFRLSRTRIAGIVFEAIGRKWLTPKELTQ